MAERMRVVVGDGQRRDERPALRMLVATCVAMALLLLVGTFFDLPISRSVAVAQGNPVVTVISTLGLLPCMFPTCVMVGACAERLRHARVSAWRRVCGGIACAALVAAAGVIGFAELFDVDGLGPVLPFAIPTPVKAMGGIALGLCCAYVGIKGARGNTDPSLVRRLVLVIATVVALFALSTLVKSIVCRPRFRLLCQGIAGIEYQPWYRVNAGGGDIAASLGIERSDMRSFPSGHIIQCASLIATYYGLMALFPSLRRGWHIVRVAFVPYLLTIMACRILLAAHFLSDVSMAGLVVAGATILLLRAETAIPAAPTRSYLRQV